MLCSSTALHVLAVPLHGYSFPQRTHAFPRLFRFALFRSYALPWHIVSGPSHSARRNANQIRHPAMLCFSDAAPTHHGDSGPTQGRSYTAQGHSLPMLCYAALIHCIASLDHRVAMPHFAIAVRPQSSPRRCCSKLRFSDAVLLTALPTRLTATPLLLVTMPFQSDAMPFYARRLDTMPTPCHPLPFHGSSSPV